MGRETWVWTPELVHELTTLWNARDLSATGIAAKLGVSRNAILGKASRLHLPKRRGQSPRSRQPDRPKPPRVPRLAVPHPRPAPMLEVVKPNGNAWEPLPGTVPLPLVDIRDGQCRWPVSQDAPFLFCACPVQPGKPYCRHHVLWSVGRGTEVERAAVRVARRIAGRERVSA